MLHSFLLRLRALLTRSRHRQQLADELAFHQAMLEDRFVNEGLPPEEAARAARRRFGSAPRRLERLAELWQWTWLENLARDVSYAARLLRRSPGFTAVAVITLALGIGANTAIFSVFDAFLLRQLPVPHPEQIVLFGHDDITGSYGVSDMCTPLYDSFHKIGGAFASVWAYTSASLNVRSASGTTEEFGMFVSGGFFPAMEVSPQLGRTLLPSDDVRGGGPGGYAAVLSDSYWRQHYGASGSALGQHLRIGDALFTIVGVMPPAFRTPDVLSAPRIFVPVQSEPAVVAPYDMLDGGVHDWWLYVGARLRPGFSAAQANAQLRAENLAIFNRLDATPAWINEMLREHSQVTAVPGARGYTFMRGHLQQPLDVLFVLCGALLLLACINLASLLLARAAAREHELATRLAIGATRSRLVQQLLVETCMLCVLGAGLGLAITPVAARILSRELFATVPNATLDLSLNWTLLLFAIATAAAAALLAGLLPAMRITASAIRETIGNNQITITRPKRAMRRLLPRILMANEVALALILVAGAGLLAISLFHLQHNGLGFDPEGVATFFLNVDAQPLQGPALLRLYGEIKDTLASDPHVVSAGYASFIPFNGTNETDDVKDAQGANVRLYVNQVSPSYFATMGIPMLAGRDFNATDTTGTGPKIILNQSAARLLISTKHEPGTTFDRIATSRHEAGGRALGRLVRDKEEVIGVVADSKFSNLTKPASPQAFEAIAQGKSAKPSYTLVVRYKGSLIPLASAARSIVARLSPLMPTPILTPMNTEIDRSIASERMLAWISVFFAVCALLVTGIGLYGTLAYTTARRTNEIGIRMALGAQRVQVVRLVVWENLLICLTGAVGGLIAALFAARLLAALLFGISAHDPWVLLGACLLLLLAGGLASLLPALHAAHIDPNAAMRTE
jgi:predicted permease